MKAHAALALVLVAVSTVCAQETPPANAKPVSFSSSGGTLYGFLYVLRGKGRFLPCCGITAAKDVLAGNQN